MKSHASMNRIYRLVFNAALGIWVAVAENAKGRGKGGRAASALLAVLVILSPAAHAANAADATVKGGSGTVATTGLTTTINQTSQRLAIDWTQLSTAANEALKFNQPNAQAIALNRITGSSPSQFLGSLTANGQVFILNPNGILFGAGSQVNVGGLVASTLGMNPTDFMNGSNTFTKTTGTGRVVNQGTMTAAQGGYLALLAPEVRNEGIMTATLGTALLAAGNKITLNLNNGSLLGYSIDQGAVNALADNKQLIKADGGQVLLSAKALDALTTATVNNTGVIEAHTIQNIAGRIMLMGDMEHGTVNVGGTLDASAQAGNGGFIETSAATVNVANNVKVTSQALNDKTGKTGTWLIDPVDFVIAATGGNITGAAMGAALGTNNMVYTSAQGTAGVNGDVLVNDNVSWSAANSLTLNAQRNIDFSGGGSLNGSNAASRVNLNAGQGTAGAIIGHSANTVVTAGTLVANAKTGIGSTGTVLRTQVVNAALTNSDSGGIYLTNTGDTTVAARSVNGDVVIRGADGATATVSGVNPGASVTVGTVGALQGITTVGTGDVRVSAGAGGPGYSMTGDGYDPAQIPPVNGAAGGAVFLHAPIRSAGAVSVSAGAGGVAGKVLRPVFIECVYAGAAPVCETYGGGYYPGSSGQTGGLSGTNINISAGTNLNIASAIVASSGNISLKAGMAAGNTLTLGGGLTVANAASDNITLEGNTLVGLPATLAANVLGITTANGIGSSTAALQTSVNQLALQNTVGGGIYVANSKSVTVAASSTNGDVVVSTAAGANGADGNPAGAGTAGGNLTVGSVNGLVGVTATGTAANQGNITLVAGNGGVGGNGAINIAAQGGDGGNGGAVIVGALLTAAKAATVTAGSGGRAGNGGDFSNSNSNGGRGGNGGAVNLNGVATVAQALSLSAGAGGSGGSGARGSGGAGGAGGSGGAASVNAAATAGQLTMAAGNGGAGGTGGNASILNGGNGGAGGSGGAVSLNAAVSAGQMATLTAGTGSSGGVGGTRGSANVATDGANGGAGSNADITLGSSASISTTGTGDAIRLAGRNFINNAGANALVVANGGRWLVWSAGPQANTFGGIQSGNNALWNSAFDAGNPTVGAAGNRFIFSGAQPAAVALVKANNASKTYGDGFNSFTFSATAQDLGAVYGNAFIDPNAGTAVTLAGTAPTSSSTGSAAAATRTGGNSGGAGYDINVDVTGASAAGYTVQADAAKGTLTVNQRVLSLTGNRVYDGGMAITGSVLSAGNTVNGDTVSFTGTGSVASKHVGTGKALTLGTLAVGGSAAANYTLAGGAATANITQANLTLTTSDVTKTYDRNSTALGTALAIGGTQLFGTDSATGGTFAFTDRNAGTGNKTVTTSGVTVNDGNSGNNYNLTYVHNTTSTINQAALTVTGVTAANKTYDGNRTAALSGTAAVAAIAGDTVTVSGTGSGLFADKNAGTGKAVSVTGYSLGGADAGNYTVATSLAATANITAKALTVSGITVANKTYDQGTSATVNTAGAVFGGVIIGDALTVSATGTFTDKNAATGKTVNLVSSYSGTDVNNYTITNQGTALANITAKTLTATATAQNKVYDGTTAATVAMSDNRITGDTLSFSQTANFVSKNVANGIVVNVSGIALGGTDAGNYTLASTTASSSANITPKALTVTANNDSRTVGSAAYSGGNGVSYLGLVTGDTGATVATGAPSYSGTSQGASAIGNYVITPVGLTLASGNYTLAYANGVLNITAAPVVVPVVAPAPVPAVVRLNLDVALDSVKSSGNFSGIFKDDVVKATGVSTERIRIQSLNDAANDE